MKNIPARTCFRFAAWRDRSITQICGRYGFGCADRRPNRYGPNFQSQIQERPPRGWPSCIWWRWREYSGLLSLAPSGPSVKAMLVPASCLHSRNCFLNSTHHFQTNETTRATLRRPLSFHWWRWRESNPRPKVLHPRLYMHSSPFDLIRRQHDVRSTPPDQHIRLTVDRCAASQWRSRDNDLTSTSTGTSGFRAKP